MSDDTDGQMRPPSEALRVVYGPASGTVITVPAGGLRLGREADQAGCLGDDGALSRRHASIGRDGKGRLVLQDLGSTNGTFVNGERVDGPRPLYSGDVIELGGSRLEVLTLGALTPPPTDSRPTETAEWDWLGDGAAPTTSAAVLQGPVPAAARAAPRRAGRGDEQRRGQASVEGQIRGIQQRTESYGEGNPAAVWTFRLERYDTAGNRLPPIPVQMRGYAFDGSLSEGDDVRVTGRWKDGTLHSERVENLTTRATVKPRSFKKVLVAFLIVVALMVGGFVMLVWYSDQAFQEQVEQSRREFCEQATELGGGQPPPGC